MSRLRFGSNAKKMWAARHVIGDKLIEGNDSVAVAIEVGQIAAGLGRVHIRLAGEQQMLDAAV